MAVDLSRLKVLIVDDNAYMLTILRTLLHGFSIKTVYESRDPADAFDIVRSDTVDIIITDRRRQEAGRTKYQGQERRAGAIAAAAAAAAATSAEGEPDPKSVDAA